MTLSVARIANTTQAALLLNTRYAETLAVLARGDATATEVARHLGKPLSSIHAQLELLLDAGVICVGATRSRAGRPMREYQLPLPWQIPFAATTAMTLRELLAGQLKVNVDLQVNALANALEDVYESPDWFVEVSALNGIIQHSIEHVRLGSLPAQAMIGASLSLRLTAEQAGNLKARLNALISEFQDAQSVEGAAGHWGLMVLLTPPDS
ncbi:winged helix-turn-helix domain-containing protein [Deinococcus sp. QL22]|uniref:winged helix-turn-helix domain-containing protein n=1 Tax=Deinococcus sp. QL22 TaxID=2939437 RepID=UPI0020180E84|nr:winged helix-turn-helix domain-containing protein [Deinococcus sp. QL22]UQN07977.1 winged helix-turn-helix domain-containing protein [Deinococcus sp. QL22]